MQLYEKITSPGGRVSYRPYQKQEPSFRVDMEIDDKQVNTLVSSITVAWLEAMKTQLFHVKKGSALATRIQAVEDAVRKMAQLSAGELDERMVHAGTVAWGAALSTLATELQREN